MSRRPAYGMVPFGDCLTGHHKKCKVEIISMGKKLVCPCTCGDVHGTEPGKTQGPSPLLLRMLAKYFPDK